MILSELDENLQIIEHRYSGKNGKWGYWVIFDTAVLDFLDNDNPVLYSEEEETIKNYVSYYKQKDILRKRYNNFKNKNMKKEIKKQKCEYVPCDQDSKWLESDGRGGLVRVCTPHRRLLNKQKRVNNNI